MPKSNKERQREVRRRNKALEKVTCSVTGLKRPWFSWAAGCLSAFSKGVSAGLFSQTSFRGGGFCICLLFNLFPADGRDTCSCYLDGLSKGIKVLLGSRGGGTPMGLSLSERWRRSEDVFWKSYSHVALDLTRGSLEGSVCRSVGSNGLPITWAQVMDTRVQGSRAGRPCPLACTKDCTKRLRSKRAPFAAWPNAAWAASGSWGQPPRGPAEVP